MYGLLHKVRTKTPDDLMHTHTLAHKGRRSSNAQSCSLSLSHTRTHTHTLSPTHTLSTFFSCHDLLALHCDAQQALTAWLRTLPDSETLMHMVFAEVKFDGSADDFFRFYKDEETTAFLAAISKVTGRTTEECKYEAGRNFLRGLLESGYGDALRTIGDDFYTMLQNLDSLHESFLPSFPTPAFRCSLPPRWSYSSGTSLQVR